MTQKGSRLSAGGKGMELCKAYNELNDRPIQAERFREQDALSRQGAEEVRRKPTPTH